MPAIRTATASRTATLARLIRDLVRDHGVEGFVLVAEACKPIAEDLVAAEDAVHGDSDLKSALEGVLQRIEELAAEADMAGEF